MKIKVDNEKCQGHAMCVAKGPDVYTLDDNGYNQMGTFVVAEGLEDQARRGARACPERVITIIEE
jgi:ferredoxin